MPPQKSRKKNCGKCEKALDKSRKTSIIGNVIDEVTKIKKVLATRKAERGNCYVRILLS